MSSEAMAPTTPIRDEIERNYRAFQARLPDLVQVHSGKWALMRHGEIVDFFDTVRDAHVAGHRLFSDDVFSVQEVAQRIIDLGWFSHALPQRPIRS